MPTRLKHINARFRIYNSSDHDLGGDIENASVPRKYGSIYLRKSEVEPIHTFPFKIVHSFVLLGAKEQDKMCAWKDI